MAGTRLEQLESFVLSVIEGRKTGFGANALRVLLHQFSLGFRGIVQVRLWLYRKGILRHQALGCQVLSVGNLTVGGTGKTPVVEVFSRSLTEQGRKVAILSRGYKKDKPPLSRRLWHALTFSSKANAPIVVSDGERVLRDSRQGGDEPYMLANNLPGVAVIVGKDRVRSGRYAIEKLGCDTLILDDGFQYQRLRHRLDVVLVDRTNPFGNRRMLPRGILREPIRNVRRAGFIFLTKSNGDGAEELKAELRRYNPHAEIIECRHRSRHLQNVFTGEQQPVEYLAGRKVAAISGIARPSSFEEALTSHGAEVLLHKVYADHHRYTQQELLDVINEAMNRGAEAILTTEKDAVRFPILERRDIPIHYLRVEIEMFNGTEAFDEWIARICFRHAAG